MHWIVLYIVHTWCSSVRFRVHSAYNMLYSISFEVLAEQPRIMGGFLGIWWILLHSAWKSSIIEYSLWITDQELSTTDDSKVQKNFNDSGQTNTMNIQHSITKMDCNTTADIIFYILILLSIFRWNSRKVCLRVRLVPRQHGITLSVHAQLQFMLEVCDYFLHVVSYTWGMYFLVSHPTV